MTGKTRRGGGNIFSMIKINTHKYDNIISVENILEAWKEFRNGKRNKVDVEEFGKHLMDNILILHKELKEKKYQHSPYHAFKISDPKPRDIHKASVRDRLLHHAIYRILYPYFDSKFIYDSYSCRIDKGTHRAIDRFKNLSWRISKNNTKPVWVLKYDIRKFFASIDHKILKQILKEKIEDDNILWLLDNIIDSFCVRQDLTQSTGLPLGNLTSQLLVNIYMNEFDQHMKHELKVKYYIRYADDFVVLNEDKKYLEELLPKISEFLEQKLKLNLHPDKVFIKTLFSGVDFLGWVHFPRYRILRTATKKRMFRKLSENLKKERVISYLGMLSYGNSHKLKNRVGLIKNL